MFVQSYILIPTYISFKLSIGQDFHLPFLPYVHYILDKEEGLICT